jgi:hypothetical protein
LPRLQGQSQRYLEAFFGDHQSAIDDPLYSHLPRLRTSAGAKAFFSDDLRAAIGDYDPLADLRERLPADFMRWHPLSQSQYLGALPPAGLHPLLAGRPRRHGKCGRGPLPFLDHRPNDLASRIPRLKLKGLVEKHILRESVKGLLPEGIAKRPKQPYRAPESQAFLRSGTRAAVLEHLTRAKVNAAGYFDAGLVERLVEKCARLPSTGFRDNLAFVGILSTQVWHDAFVGAAAENPGIALASPVSSMRRNDGATQRSSERPNEMNGGAWQTIIRRSAASSNRASAPRGRQGLSDPSFSAQASSIRRASSSSSHSSSASSASPSSMRRSCRKTSIPCSRSPSTSKASTGRMPSPQ